MTRAGIIVCLLAVGGLLPAARAETPPRRAVLKIKLPKPMFIGTPKNMKTANLEPPRKAKRRPPFLAPAGVKNLALGKKVTGSDSDPIVGELALLTDGDKDGGEGSYMVLGPGKQYVQIDLGQSSLLYVVVLWHFHNQPRVYRDVVVQCSDDPTFARGVRTVFNNDHDNSAGLGRGTDKEYIETYEGRLIDLKGARGRYLRLYSRGSNDGEMNHYVEVEAYGLPAPAGKGSGKLAFSAGSKKEEYRFDTGVLRGTLRRGGASRGLSSLTHVPSGTRFDGSLGILSHYRVFTKNKRYGPAAWGWPSTSKLLPDGAVQVNWPKAKDRPFQLTAVYRWAAPDTLDVTTTVTAAADLPGFESFLASYFNRNFPATSVYAQGPKGPRFATTPKSAGHWQMFPRDRKMISVIQDGRWKQNPHPVAWAIRENLAAPLGIRRGKGNPLVAILMAPAEDCYALSTPFAGEGHFSLYMSLFGRDVKAGQSATARARLVIANSPTDRQIVEMYTKYVARPAGPRE